MSYVPRLKKQYDDEVVQKLQERFEYKSAMQVPKIEKICLNQGLGKAISDRKIIDSALEELAMVTGQKAVTTYSTKDVSNFKLRKGMPVGARVTLRRERMYEFLDRLIHVSLPRTRDFQGVKASGFDGRGNFSFGIQEQIIFPEIDLDKVKHLNGMHITIVTNARTNEEAKELLAAFGFPFKKN
ncbi:MAG: 50S ribosomal protein L5 [Flavobacteriales bacterium]